MKVAEVFGPTVQGEGPSVGRRCGFIRLGGCNLACSWCDTPFTWDWTGRNGVAYDPHLELRQAGSEELVDQLVAMSVPLAVITGGEPMVQGSAVAELTRQLNIAGMDVEIETNGTRLPPSDLLRAKRVRFNVSPKLANSGEPVERRIRPDVLRILAGRADTAFKFVAADPADLDEIAGLVEGLALPAAQVWIMPEGTSTAAITDGLDKLAEATIAAGFNLTTRLHVLVWGDRRGV